MSLCHPELIMGMSKDQRFALGLANLSAESRGPANSRRLGGSESARTEHPNREVVSSCPCVRARSVIHVESGMKCRFGRLPFSLLGLGVFPFSFQNSSVGACLSKSAQI